jgi:transposase-like protein
LDTREIARGYRLAHWTQIIREHRESGKTVKAYCERNGIRENTYYYWQKKIREALCEELGKKQAGIGQTGMTAPVFREVKLSRQQIPSSSTTAYQDQIYIETSGMRITAGNGYPSDKLAAIIREIIQELAQS